MKGYFRFYNYYTSVTSIKNMQIGNASDNNFSRRTLFLCRRAREESIMFNIKRINSSVKLTTTNEKDSCVYFFFFF